MSYKIKQHDANDCGAACLASAAAFYKLKLPVARIRQFAGTDKQGTNVLGLVEAAKKLGFEARGVRASAKELSNIPLPAIAHVAMGNQQHYVVIYKVTDRNVEIMDPAGGQMKRMAFADFTTIWTGVLVLLQPDPFFTSRNEKVSNTLRFWQLIQPHKSILIQALFGAFIYTLLGLSTSVFVQKITDHVLVDGNRNLLQLMSVLMIGLLLLQTFIGTVKTIFTMRTGQQIDARLILGYYKHLLKLPQSFFDTMRVGEIISRINDAVKIRTFINDVSVNLVVNVFIVVLSFALMFGYYPKLALLMLAVIPLYMAVYFVVNLLHRKVQRKLMEDGAELESQLVESLQFMGTIKRFGLESFTHLKTETRFIQLLRTAYKSGLNTVFSGTSAEIISQLWTILLLWMGAGYVLDQEITAGELFSFYVLAGYFTAPVASLIGANKVMQDALIAADRLFEIMDLEVESQNEGIHLTAAEAGDIRFEAVTFRYGTRVPVFENLNLHIKKGSFTAFVGESGCGKSTLMALLQHVYPIQAGSIRIGEYALTYLHKNTVRSFVASVPQQIDLFAGNVIDNIAIGEEAPDMQHIVDMCTALGILPFIENLPDGFYTYLGENGATLSGGQKQRIAIARALYRKPEILILDEATSALDYAAAQYVQRAVNLLRTQGKTIMVVAHQLSTVRKADQIVVLHQGKVVEAGKHEELIALNGHYHQMWQQQSGND